jgi:hypothetical protein
MGIFNCIERVGGRDYNCPEIEKSPDDFFVIW